MNKSRKKYNICLGTITDNTFIVDNDLTLSDITAVGVNYYIIINGIVEKYFPVCMTATYKIFKSNIEALFPNITIYFTKDSKLFFSINGQEPKESPVVFED